MEKILLREKEKMDQRSEEVEKKVLDLPTEAEVRSEEVAKAEAEIAAAEARMAAKMEAWWVARGMGKTTWPSEAQPFATPQPSRDDELGYCPMCHAPGMMLGSERICSAHWHGCREIYRF